MNLEDKLTIVRDSRKGFHCFKRVFYNFLSTINLKLLLIEVSNAYLVSSRCKLIIQEFAETNMQDQLINKYLKQEKQQSLRWDEFVGRMNSWMSIPIVMLEFHENFIKDEREVLEKFDTFLKLTTAEKIILVCSKTALFDEYLRNSESGDFLKIGEYGNELPLRFAQNINIDLHVAVERNHKEIVLELLESNADVNVTTSNGWSPLHFAAYNGDKDVVLALLKKGADINIQGGLDCTALHLAAQNDHNDVIRLLLQFGADVNIQDGGGSTALHLASEKGYKDIVVELLNHDANVDILDDDGKTALYWAAQNGHTEIVQALLNTNPDVNFQCFSKFTALHIAVIRNRQDTVAKLLEHNGDIYAQDDNKRTVLHEAAFWGHRDMVLILLKNGANANIRTKKQQMEMDEVKETSSLNSQHDTHYNISFEGESALHIAAARGHARVVLALLKCGAHADIKNDDGRTALHSAVMNDRQIIVNILSANMNDVNTPDFYGSTALHEAVCMNNLKIINILLDYNVEINVKNSNNGTPLHLAAFNGYAEVFELLRAKGADVTVKNKQNLTAIELREKINNFPLLLPLNEKENHSTRIPLHFAASLGQTDIVLEHLKHGANVNTKNDNERTALHLAVMNGHNEIAKILLKYTDDVNTHDIYGFSILHEAVCKGNLEVVNLLLDCGAKVNDKNDNNDTPLHLAAYYGHSEVFELLKRRGADGNIRNKQSFKPIDFKKVTDDLSPELQEIRRKHTTIPEKTNNIGPFISKSSFKYNHHTTCTLLPLVDAPNSFLFIDLEVTTDKVDHQDVYQMRQIIHKANTKK